MATVETTLLVDDDLVLETLQMEARQAFMNALKYTVRDEASGEAGRTLVKVILTQAQYDAIVQADRFANTHNAEPEISVTEYDRT